MPAFDSPALPCAAWPPSAPEMHGWRAGGANLILDLDGTLIREHEPIDGAAELLHAFRGRYVIVSNNSTHTARQMARRLRGMGLPVRTGDLILAGEQLVDYLCARHAGQRVLLRASPALRRQAAARGCHLVDCDAQVVALALDKRFDYAALVQVTQELAHGAKLVASNIDLTHPGPDGQVVPETGALLRAVQACTAASWHAVGKPGPAMFREGLRRLGSTPANTLVIGDNPQTDAAGAARAGLRCVLIGNGAQAVAGTPGELLAMRLRCG
ncbi:HAD-IIA family hydrolase [Bordetella petrii]|uniref:HAD-IIA family hydrolase n=1 Tax=Bordetella petrii TaxID=94624 RepID=UPI001E64CE76|nr:HAD-IIA family hydrolase [Bordetella petrii]MCD0504352.1 HAD-IIA family hydrolase [Bordetella petrii]